MKKIYFLFTALLLAAPFFSQSSLMAQEATQVATFEDLKLEANSCWFGPAENAVEEKNDYGFRVLNGTFQSGSYEFSNSYVKGGSGWSGFAYSNLTSTEYDSNTDLSKQLNSCVGHGVEGSATYAVAGETGVVKVLGSAEGEIVKGMYVTNYPATLYSMINGDFYAHKFKKGDYFKVIFTGTKADNSTAQVEFYLADYRSENEAERYMVKDWTYVDLSSLGKIVSLSFSFDGSDKEYGYLNDPTYFCLDNLGADKTATGISAKYANMVELHEVARYTVDGKKIVAPQKGINIVRMSDGSVRKVVVD